jgi:hypothetical protein
MATVTSRIRIVTATVAFALVCAGTTRADEIVDGEYIVVCGRSSGAAVIWL